MSTAGNESDYRIYIILDNSPNTRKVLLMYSFLKTNKLNLDLCDFFPARLFIGAEISWECVDKLRAVLISMKKMSQDSCFSLLYYFRQQKHLEKEPMPITYIHHACRYARMG